MPQILEGDIAGLAPKQPKTITDDDILGPMPPMPAGLPGPPKAPLPLALSPDRPVTFPAMPVPPGGNIPGLNRPAPPPQPIAAAAPAAPKVPAPPQPVAKPIVPQNVPGMEQLGGTPPVPPMPSTSYVRYRAPGAIPP